MRRHIFGNYFGRVFNVFRRLRKNPDNLECLLICGSILCCGSIIGFDIYSRKNNLPIKSQIKQTEITASLGENSYSTNEWMNEWTDEDYDNMCDCTAFPDLYCQRSKKNFIGELEYLSQ